MAGFVKMKLEGAAEVQRELEKLAKKAGLLGEDFADYAAGVAQKTVIRNVQPFGLGKKARVKGEGAIYKDLHRAFRIVKRSGKGVIESVSEAKRHHQSVRNSRGRVPTSARKKIISYSCFTQYKLEAVKGVGKAKGGFTDEGQRLGNRMQGWMKRHQEEGRSSRSKGMRGVVWTFKNKTEHSASGYVMGERGIQRALRVQQRNLKRSLEGKLRRMGKI